MDDPAAVPPIHDAPDMDAEARDGAGPRERYPDPAPASSTDRARIDFERARDKALVEVALGGDLDAFNQLVEFHQDHLFGVAFRVIG